MRNSTAYVIAGCITLLSLPMYWSIYQRSQTQAPAEPPSSIARAQLPSRAPVRRLVATLPGTAELSPNQRCIAEMVVAVDGNSYTPLKERGSIVPCHGRVRDHVATVYVYATQ